MTLREMARRPVQATALAVLVALLTIAVSIGAILRPFVDDRIGRARVEAELETKMREADGTLLRLSGQVAALNREIGEVMTRQASMQAQLDRLEKKLDEALARRR